MPPLSTGRNGASTSTVPDSAVVSSAAPRRRHFRLPVMSRVQQARRVLMSLGVLGVTMTGSGSSVFGFVSSHGEGERVAKRLSGYPWRVFLTSCHG